MKIQNKIAVIATLVLLLFANVSNAQKIIRPGPGVPGPGVPGPGVPGPGVKGTWKVLGTRQANFGVDHDKIIVNGPYDYYRQLKFKVTDAPLNLLRITVRYDDGGLPENVEVRFNIPQGGESRIIDLKGTKRKIRSVEFWYDTKGILKGKANVTLFGIK